MTNLLETTNVVKNLRIKLYLMVLVCMYQRIKFIVYQVLMVLVKLL